MFVCLIRETLWGTHHSQHSVGLSNQGHCGEHTTHNIVFGCLIRDLLWGTDHPQHSVWLSNQRFIMGNRPLTT